MFNAITIVTVLQSVASSSIIIVEISTSDVQVSRVSVRVRKAKPLGADSAYLIQNGGIFGLQFKKKKRIKSAYRKDNTACALSVFRKNLHIVTLIEHHVHTRSVTNSNVISHCAFFKPIFYSLNLKKISLFIIKQLQLFQILIYKIVRV